MTAAARDTEKWLLAARSGNPDAVGLALESCRNYLLLIAEREISPRLKAKGGASDVVQQTFLEAHQAFERFQGDTEQELLAWLRRMLLNNVANFRRHYDGTDKRRTDREIPMDAGNSQGGGNSWIPSGGLTPSRELMVDERDAQLNAAIARLPEDYQQVLRLRYREDCSFDDIAVTMNRTANAVRKLWARAVERLQQELEMPHDPGSETTRDG
ncbi:MAG: sigma-70 family RNA polymerase sigma factor [Gemmataceae bacterium]|nr:sigma-70 family RNA polymerase sigma factor [Gemmataceae bacterium]